MAFDNRPLGVFDSGIGGLTVLRELIHEFPNESFVYLGDTARLPYGAKSPQTIRKYSEQNVEFLLKQDVKAVVIACNSASAQFPESEFKSIPTYNVIGPGVERALSHSKTLRIGVLGTRATIKSQAYSLGLKSKNPKVEVFDVACPLLVPLAEEGWDADPLTNLIVYRYVSQILPQNIDTLILGCTHYPLLKNSISRATGASVELIDSGEAMAQLLKQEFQVGRIQPSQERQFVKVLTTDFSEHFNSLAERILKPYGADSYGIVDL